MGAKYAHNLINEIFQFFFHFYLFFPFYLFMVGFRLCSRVLYEGWRRENWSCILKKLQFTSEFSVESTYNNYCCTLQFAIYTYLSTLISMSLSLPSSIMGIENHSFWNLLFKKKWTVKRMSREKCQQLNVLFLSWMAPAFDATFPSLF